jgi:hypothetical protein
MVAELGRSPGYDGWESEDSLAKSPFSEELIQGIFTMLGQNMPLSLLQKSENVRVGQHSTGSLMANGAKL